MEYHDKFRQSVLEVEGDGLEQARNPQTLKDFETVETLLFAAKPVDPEDLNAFKDFAQRFSGWFKSHEITAPPDMTETLGANYEDEQTRKVVDGELSLDEYQRNVQSLTERRQWAGELRAEYQREWRAEVARRVDWARGSGVMERDDFMALVLVENPHDADLKELVESVARMAKRL